MIFCSVWPHFLSPRPHSLAPSFLLFPNPYLVLPPSPPPPLSSCWRQHGLPQAQMLPSAHSPGPNGSHGSTRTLAHAQSMRIGTDSRPGSQKQMLLWLLYLKRGGPSPRPPLHQDLAQWELKTNQPNPTYYTEVFFFLNHFTLLSLKVLLALGSWEMRQGTFSTSTALKANSYLLIL